MLARGPRSLAIAVGLTVASLSFAALPAQAAPSAAGQSVAGQSAARPSGAGTAPSAATPTVSPTARPSGASSPPTAPRASASAFAHGVPVLPPSVRAALARIPRRLYDPVGANGVPQHELLSIAAELTAGAPRADYSGVALDTRRGIVTVYLANTSTGVLEQALARVPVAQRGLVQVRQVPLPLTTLNSYMARATDAVRRLLASHVDVRSWWPDFTRGVIAVVLYKPRPGQVAAARRALAGIPSAIGATTAALSTTSDPTCPFPLTTGVNSACDTSPWTGADFTTNGGTCTDSWPIMMGASYYMLTAGHCTKAANSVDFVNEGDDSGSFGSDISIGTGEQNALNNTSSSVDAQLIPGSAGVTTFLPQVWTGNTTGNVAASTPLPVLGAATPPSGTSICSDGAYEGKVCGAVVQQDNYDSCQTSSEEPGVMFCHTYEAMLSSGVLLGKGDSGGPDFEITSSGVTGVGLNSLGNPGNLTCPAFTGRGPVCSNIAFFTGLNDILSHYGASLMPPVLNLSGGGQFAQEWASLGSANGYAGEPVAAWTAAGSGQQQLFQTGGIYWSSNTGTHGVYEAANNLYTSLSGPAGKLGFPVSENLSPLGGDEWQFAGTNCTAANSPNGSGSAILGALPISGPDYEVQGCIYQDYLRYGGPTSTMGFPTTNEQAIYSGTTQIGRVSNFAGQSRPTCSTGSEPTDGKTTAAIYWNPVAGATHGVYGCIFAEYHSLGEASGSLGFPIDDAYATNGGHQQDFQNGTIFGSNGSYSVSYNGKWVAGHAAHAGNNYPYETMGQFDHSYEGSDAWNEYYGQCDSFGAWKVYENLAGSKAQLPNIPVPAVGWRPSNASVSPINQNTWFNADNWDVMAKSVGWTVNTIPAPGTIAYWPNATTDPQDGHPTSPNGIGGFGHVGYVTDVYPDGSVTIEMYNLRLNGEYSTIHMAYGQSAVDTSYNQGSFTVPWPTDFIHVGDGIGSSTPASPEPANGTVSWGYSSQVKVIGPGSSSSQFSLGNVWYLDSGHGEIGEEEWTHDNGPTAVSTATYAPAGLTASACYRVDAFVPNNYSDNPAAVYTVADTNGPHMAAVNENVFTNDWAELGVYETNGSGVITVKLDDRGTTGLYVAADAMRFWRTSCSVYGDVAPIIMPTSKSSGWTLDSGHGFFASMTYSVTSGSQTVTGNTATWTPSGLSHGICYEVEAYVPDNYSDNNAAVYHVSDYYYGNFYPQVNENSFTNQFTDLGGFMTNGTGGLTVTLQSNGPPGQYVAADALAFTPDPLCEGPMGSGLGSVYSYNQIGPGSAPSSFWTANPWFTRLGHGYTYHELWTYDNGSTADSTARWNFFGSANACYNIQAFIPDNYADNTSAHYTISTDNGVTTAYLNQARLTYWSSLAGHVKTGPDGLITIVLDDTGPVTDSLGNPLYTAADAMEFDPIAC